MTQILKNIESDVDSVRDDMSGQEFTSNAVGSEETTAAYNAYIGVLNQLTVMDNKIALLKKQLATFNGQKADVETIFISQNVPTGKGTAADWHIYKGDNKKYFTQVSSPAYAALVKANGLVDSIKAGEMQLNDLADSRSVLANQVNNYKGQYLEAKARYGAAVDNENRISAEALAAQKNLDLEAAANAQRIKDEEAAEAANIRLQQQADIANGIMPQATTLPLQEKNFFQSITKKQWIIAGSVAGAVLIFIGYKQKWFKI